MPRSALHPDAADDSLPSQVGFSPVQDVGLQAIGRLKFEEKSGSIARRRCRVSAEMKTIVPGPTFWTPSGVSTVPVPSMMN